MKTIKNYDQHYAELQVLMNNYAKQQPEVMGAFEGLINQVMEKGALSARSKELMALAIAITVRCDGCIAFHIHSCLAAGASTEEIAETIGVSIMMGGGPSVIYGIEAFEALQQCRQTA